MPMEAMQDLGARIRQVRGKVSQEEFARRLGISKGALGCYERGVNCPNVEVVLGICRLCRISVEWLVAGSGPMMAPRAPGGGSRTGTAPHRAGRLGARHGGGR